jgi:1,4-alpha-glucan branching enzyme
MAVKGRAKSKVLTRGVEFEFPAPQAKKVYLAGNFNDWDTRQTPMIKDRKGIWRATLQLEAGKYEYRFFVDGQWENDPSCTSWVPNEFGTQNCLRVVG